MWKVAEAGHFWSVTMRILFNQMSTLERKTGVGHYAHQLRHQLSQRPDCQLSVFPTDGWLTWNRRARRCLELLKSLPGRLRHRDRPRTVSDWLAGSCARRRLRKWTWQSYRRWVDHLQRQAFFSDAFDLYHEPNFIPVPSSLPTVVTVHDLSVLLHPEWHPAERVQWYKDQFSRTLSQASHIITVSEFTRQQVIRLLGIPDDCVTTVANGPRPEFRPLPAGAIAEVLRARGLPPQYLLYVGTIEPRKNILRLMQAYISLPAGLRRDWPLVLVGGWGWDVDAVRSFYEDVAVHQGVRHLGYMPDEDLPAIFNGARALVYPSHYEGFGLPPLEMMACGGAVLASRIPPHIEVTGGAAHLIAPEDTDGWHEAMEKVILDDAWHQELCTEAAARARLYSWARSARETAQVYRHVLESSSSSHLRTHAEFQQAPVAAGNDAACQRPRNYAA